MNKTLACTFNLLASVILMVLGIIYLFNPQYMPYHRQAVSLPWEEVPMEFQKLILALMKALGGAYLAVGITISLLQIQVNKTRNTLAVIIIFVSGIVVTISSLYASLLVRINTPGKAPYYLALLGGILLIAGLYYNIKQTKAHKKSATC
ncbi:hypothetical protein [Carboxylicivirga linearis]|uniref:Uncharacterized protein n=1 Tax=Carboxylicivirga linearis TaxID=1628157 RepID=A0ABS5JWP3_9BACT|nr:hypothetical protein [Carboxylicivirga linearis]MBS2098889.1 hypothetical protein [Carboxylicivirga linearis]